MSNIKLVHSGGNSVSLTTPTSNPSSNITFKLPQSDGSAGQVLKTDGNGNLSWVTLPTDTYADTGLSATINISAGSKVLIMCVLHLDVERSSSTNSRCAIKLLRGSTDIFAPPSNKNVGIEGASSAMVMFLPLHFSFLDTGASTGSNTYKLQGRVTSSGNSPRVRFQDSSNPSTMTLLEIAG